MLLLWNIAFSPYGPSGRISAPCGIALCLLGLRLVTGDARVRHTPGTLAGSPTRAAVSRRTTPHVDVALVGPAGAHPK